MADSPRAARAAAPGAAPGSGAPRSALEAQAQAQWIALAPFVFQASVALRNTGILAELEKHPDLSQADLAQRTGLPEYGTRVLLEAGLAIGLVTEDAERRYRITRTTRFLLHDPIARVNMDFAHDVSYRPLFHLEDAVRTGKPAGLREFGDRWRTVYEALAHLPQHVRRSWFAYDHYFSDAAFPDALPRVLARKPRRLLDIGGNTGKWALLALRADPALEVTLMDLPGQLGTAREALAGSGVEGRVHYLEADLLDPRTEIPRGFDVIWMSQFLDCFSDAQIVSILERCRPALGAGSRVCILEPFWDRQRHPVAAFCQSMLSLYFTALANGNSQIYRSDVFLRCVQNAGLTVEESVDGLGVGHTLLFCRA